MGDALMESTATGVDADLDTLARTVRQVSHEYFNKKWCQQNVTVLDYSLCPITLLCRLHNLPHEYWACLFLDPDSGNMQAGCSLVHRTDQSRVPLLVPLFMYTYEKSEEAVSWTCPRHLLWQTPIRIRTPGPYDHWFSTLTNSITVATCK